MTSIKFSGWLAGAVFACAIAATPAHALTMMQAPVDSNGQSFADPDDKVQNNFSGDSSNQNSPGIHFSVRPSGGSAGPGNQPAFGPSRLTDPSSPYYNPPGPSRYWGPGMQR